jgi:hypothetical protein
MRGLLYLCILALSGTLLAGCVEESSTIVSFDEVLESTTFENRLLAPVLLRRDGEVLDTIPASSVRTYTIGRKGPVRHSWKLIAPLDRYGNKAGIEPSIDLGVQYALNGRYTITNELEDGSLFGSATIFTPLVANFSPYPIRLIVNYREEDQAITDYLIPRNIDSMLRHAPYFYWNSESNIRLESTVNNYVLMFFRSDTNEQTQLRLDTDSHYRGTGRTVPIVVH